MRWKEQTGRNAVWHEWTYAELWQHIRAVSLGLRKIGVRRGTRVAILSRSCPEWVVADLATLALGAVTCPIYHGESPSRIDDVLCRVRARVVFVQGAAEAAAVNRAMGRTGVVRHVIAFDPAGCTPETIALTELLDGPLPDPGVDRRWRTGWERIVRSHVATVVHTLSDGGQLLGAVLTHGSVLHNYAAVLRALPLTRDEVVLSVLPLSHMLERVAGLYVPLGLGATVAYTASTAHGWRDAVQDIRPTAVIGVPVLVDRLAADIHAGLEEASGSFRRLVAWAIRLGRRRYAALHGGVSLPVRVRLQCAVADALVARLLRGRLGGRLRFVASGGAPLRKRTGLLMFSLGIPIVEGYGLTETGPLLTLNRLEAPRFGTVGYPVAGTEIRIGRKGEILARGPQVMLGYLDDAAATARAIDGDGWFHTGDVGRFDHSGRLVICGRLKRLIVLTTGKKVSPAPMEAALSASPLIAEAVVLGEHEPVTRVVVVPSPAAVAVAGADRKRLLPGRSEGSRRDLRRLVEAEVARRLAGFAPYERPRRVEIVAPGARPAPPRRKG